jgi:alpha-L-arabinofuranosidase
MRRLHCPPRNRRTFLTASAAAAAGIAACRVPADRRVPTDDGTPDGSTIAVDPTPLFELSPYLFIQFMEPLGATGGSVEAAWDHLRDDWR